MQSERVIGVDIGGTKCAVILSSVNGDQEVSIEDRIAFATEAHRGPDYTLSRIRTAVHEILNRPRVRKDHVRGMGITCGGPLDSAQGLILSPPNLPGWDRIPIVDLFEKEYGIPVWLQNDANAGAMAEHRFGAGRGLRNLIFCTMGTGFGAGLILNGQLYSGTNDMAGEVGHIRLSDSGPPGYGKCGSVEGYCSGAGLAQLARLRILEHWRRGQKVSFCDGHARLESLTAKIVGEAAEAGDRIAIEIFREVGNWLGRTLSLMVDLLNPEMIVLGGIFFRQHHLLWPEARRVMAEESLPLNLAACRVVPTALGERIGDYASLVVAITKLYQSDTYESIRETAIE